MTVTPGLAVWKAARQTSWAAFAELAPVPCNIPFRSFAAAGTEPSPAGLAGLGEPGPPQAVKASAILAPMAAPTRKIRTVDPFEGFRVCRAWGPVRLEPRTPA